MLALNARLSLRYGSTIRFEVTNTGAELTYILKRGLPLEGLLTPCLRVTGPASEDIPYDGPVLLRKRPNLDEFLPLDPGETTAREFDLAESFTLQAGGQYALSLRSPIWSCRDISGDNFDNITSLACTTIDATAVIELRETSSAKQTIGQRSRALNEPRSSSFGERQLAGPRAPTFNEVSTARRSSLTMAHTTAYNKAEAAVNSLQNNTEYATWFGTHTTSRFNAVKGTYQSVKSKMETDAIIYDMSNARNQFCNGAIYAWTTFENPRIYICDDFFESLPSPVTAGGLLLHEFSHIVNRSIVDVSGAANPASCRALATQSPAQAITNGYNYQFYTGG